MRKVSDSRIDSEHTPELEFKSDSRRGRIRIECVTKNGALLAARLNTEAPASRTLKHRLGENWLKIGVVNYGEMWRNHETSSYTYMQTYEYNLKICMLL